MKKQKIVLLLFLPLINLALLNSTNITFEELNSWCTPLEQLKQITFTHKANLPLFKEYPNLQNRLPHISLGNFPTPIKKLENLEKEIGIKNLYFKDDGQSSKPFGGNKIRKSEFLFAHALENNAKTVMAVGDAGSNCTLALTTCSQKLGLKTIIMLTPQLNTSYARRNLLLSSYHGAELNYFQTTEERDLNIIQTIQELKEQEGQYPYFIPSGGSCPIGSVGFVNAAFELKKQIEEKLLPEPDYIYVTLGSSSTAAGLILGLQLANIKSKIIPVRISGTVEMKTELLKNMFNNSSKFLNKLDPEIPELDFPQNKVFIHHDFVGETYAAITQEGANAIKLLHQTEEIKLDSTYTGKTFAALLDDAQKENFTDKTILFWNTFCPGEFSETTNQVNYKDLSQALHYYFENDVQELDQGV